MGEEVSHSDLATLLTLIHDGVTMGGGCFVLFYFSLFIYLVLLSE